MINLTKLLQNNLKSMMISFDNLQYLAKDAYDAYWDTDANTKVAGLGAGEQALISPQVAKENYQNGTTLADNIYKFFNNSAVATTDHLAYSNLIKHGTYFATPISAELSPATATVGDMLERLAIDCIELLQQARTNMNIYNDNEITDIAAVLDGERVIFGSDMTRNDLVNAIVLLQQFENFMTSQTVTTGDYSTTVSKWKAY